MGKVSYRHYAQHYLKMFEKQFKALANEYAAKIAKVSDRTCEDQYVGTVGSFTGTDKFVRHSIAAIPPDVTHLIVLILESPHIDEYRPEVPVPANGPTGAKIRDHLLNILNHDAINKRETPLVDARYEDCGVILMNGVQYQCSLGLEPANVLAGDVFRRAWRLFGKKNFKDRLNDYIRLRSGKVLVVNACTVGCTQGLPKDEKFKELRQMVEGAVDEAVGYGSHIRLAHPSSWWSSRNRRPNTWPRPKK